jgi:hypothetical protein
MYFWRHLKTKLWYAPKLIFRSMGWKTRTKDFNTYRKKRRMAKVIKKQDGDQ